MAAVGTELLPDCEGFGDSVVVSPVVELALTDVEGIETNVQKNNTAVEHIVGLGVGVGVVELVRTMDVVDS